MRRVRSLGVFCEVVESDISLDKIKSDSGIRGIILSGGLGRFMSPGLPGLIGKF